MWRVDGILTLIPNAALIALGGHELLEVTFVCNQPLQVLDLCVVLGEVLHYFLLQQDHLGLSISPEIQPVYIYSQTTVNYQIWNIIMVLVSNRTCHHKQQWNSLQLLRSFCVVHGAPGHVYVFFARVYVNTHTIIHRKNVTKTHFCSDLFQPGSKLLEADLLNMKSLQLFSQLAVSSHLLTKVGQSLNHEKVHNLSHRKQ